MTAIPSSGTPQVIAVEGLCFAGKTTLARALARPRQIVAAYLADTGILEAFDAIICSTARPSLPLPARHASRRGGGELGRRLRLTGQGGSADRNDGTLMLLRLGGQPQPWAIVAARVTSMGHRCGCAARPGSVNVPSLRLRRPALALTATPPVCRAQMTRVGISCWRRLAAGCGRAYATVMWPIGRPAQWVGREQELAILRAGIEALGRGEGKVIWVEGELVPEGQDPPRGSRGADPACGSRPGPRRTGNPPAPARRRARERPRSGRGHRVTGHFFSPHRNDGPAMLLRLGGQPQPWATDAAGTTSMGHRCGCPARLSSIDVPSLRFAAGAGGELPRPGSP